MLTARDFQTIASAAGLHAAPRSAIFATCEVTAKNIEHREGYQVGARPPELSEEAERRLQQLKVSPKLMALVERARKAKVIRTGRVCSSTAATGPDDFAVVPEPQHP